MKKWLLTVTSILAVCLFLSLDLIVSDASAKSGGRGSSGGYKGGDSRSGGSVTVRPHTRRDGSYVEGHRRSGPNSTQRDNYSTKGNVNPYTGKSGTKEADR
nr:hypothetical protein [Nitrospirota bacterium]